MSERKQNSGPRGPSAKPEGEDMKPLLTEDPVLVPEENLAAKQIDTGPIISNTTHFVPIPLRSFLSTETAFCDIYIRVGEAKFVKVIKLGQAFDASRLARYEGHHVETLFLRPEDFTLYVERCLSLAKVISDKNSNVPGARKLGALTSISEAVFNEIFHLEINETALKHSMTVTHDMVELLETQRELSMLLGSLEKVGEAFVRHSIGVSALSTVLAYNLGWQGYSTLSTLSLSGFFHDIGFKELPLGLWEKPRANMTPDEIALYETHPERGKDILSSLRSIPPHVIAIVGEHHEKPNGNGFPRQLKFDRILPLSRFIAFADILAHELLVSPRNPEPATGHQVLVRMESIYRHDFPPDYWRSLQRFVESSKKQDA